MKICTFQGTFNPLHNGHAAMAEFVRQNFEYDKIIFIPANKPPHKEYDESLSKARYNLVKAYVDSHPAFEISDIEYRRNEPSYTYVTIKELQKIYKTDKFGFIIGQDAFSDIESWYETKKLKELLDFIVFLRDNEKEPDVFKELRKKGYNFTIAKNWQRVDVSSTQIRELVKNNSAQAIEKFVPKEVKDFIVKNELYI